MPDPRWTPRPRRRWLPRAWWTLAALCGLLAFAAGRDGWHAFVVLGCFAAAAAALNEARLRRPDRPGPAYCRACGHPGAGVGLGGLTCRRCGRRDVRPG